MLEGVCNVSNTCSPDLEAMKSEVKTVSEVEMASILCVWGVSFVLHSFGGVA